MKLLLAALALIPFLALPACKAASGAAIGAGTAGISGGDVATGAVVGGSVGAVLEVMD